LLHTAYWKRLSFLFRVATVDAEGAALDPSLRLPRSGHVRTLPADREKARLRQPGLPLPPGTRRRFNPNIQAKRYWLPSEGRYVRLTLSAKGIKTVDRIGIEKAVARIRPRA
jgi:ribosomal protein L28